MGSYVKSQLLNDEQVQYEVKVHWAVYIRPAIITLVAIAFVRAGQGPMWLALLIGFFFFLHAYLQVVSTELAVTNKRVIAKFGFIRRFTLDQQLSRVEGVTYDQSIMGRILGYATIIVRGTGGGHTPIPMVDNPEAFRQAVQQRLS
jgi:uncharacterized membrane protein YdbT with pleckstrin-like domain